MLNDALLNQIGDFHCQPWTQLQYKGDPVRLLTTSQLSCSIRISFLQRFWANMPKRETLLVLLCSQLLFFYCLGPRPSPA